MKFIKEIFSPLVLIGFLLLNINLIGQQDETITVPLSNPGEQGFLRLSNHNGTVDIQGYDGDEILVYVKGEIEKNENRGRNKRGLRRIVNRSLDISIVEEDNVVKIGSSNNHKNYELKVPRNFSLSISTHHNGQITVDGVSGELELDAHHGGIKATNIKGSVIADTHHGAIIVTFDDIDSEVPMAFTTYHGDVDITFPAQIAANLKMKTSKGEIYTDFDFDPLKPEVEEDYKGSKREIRVSKWTHGKIGNGGEEMMFDTYHGDIIIRSK